MDWFLYHMYLRHVRVNPLKHNDGKWPKAFEIFWPFFNILHEGLTLMQMSASELIFSKGFL